MNVLFVLLQTRTMQVNEIEVSIVMPCLNEAEALPYCLEKAFSFLQKNNIGGEVVVVDNGSDDDSANIALSYGANVVKENIRGYGAAIMGGVKEARGQFIIIGDADDSYDFSDIMPFVIHLRQGADLVIGNRFGGGIQKHAMPFLHRYFGNPILSFLGRIFFHIPINDFHCGLRGIRKESFNQLNLKTTGMEFASEMIVKAALHNLTIKQSSIILYPDKRNRRSHLKTWQDGWRHLRFLLLYSPRWLFLIPGIALMILGIIGTIVLAIGPIELGNKKLDVHTLVYTSGFILLGFQFISFYFFSRLYAAVHQLWPGQERFLQNFNTRFRLERGIMGGMVLLIGGFILMIKSLLYWRNTHYGNIDPVVVLRWVIPSIVLLVLGVQLVMSFFYLSFLTIKSKE
jgi:glycosyltransferase involved in cell wall biosynthesis